MLPLHASVKILVLLDFLNPFVSDDPQPYLIHVLHQTPNIGKGNSEKAIADEDLALV